MAKLPVCASCWFPPAAVAAAAPWHSARPISRVWNVQPLGRRGSSPAPIWIQVRRERDTFRFRSQKCTDHHTGPEPERDNNDHDVAARKEIPFEDLIPANSDVPIIQELRKNHVALAAAAGMREAPDIFRKEKDEICNYMIEIASSCAKIRDSKNKVMALIVCAEAQKALDLASMVMDLTDIASLDVGTTEFSQHTLNQMVRNYASIIHDVAEDAYKNRIRTDNIPAFLDALRGIGLVCSILVQDTAAMLKDGPLKNSISSDMEKQSREFEKKFNNLKEEVATENKHAVVMDILFDGMKYAQSYISQLIYHRCGAICDLLQEKISSMWRQLRET